MNVNILRTKATLAFPLVLKVETCNTTDSLRKTATSRIESHMRHVVCRILTVYDSTRDVAYQGFTTIYLGRGMSHTVTYYWERHFWQTYNFWKFPRDLMGIFSL